MDAKVFQKYAKRDIPWLKAKAVEYFNAFIRLRDSFDGWFTCISCGRNLPISDMNAGHYYPSTVSALRFHEKNVNGQCIRCNMHLHGNLIEYRKGLVKKYGEDAVKELDQLKEHYDRSGMKWDRFSLIEIIETYKAKSK